MPERRQHGAFEAQGQLEPKKAFFQAARARAAQQDRSLRKLEQLFIEQNAQAHAALLAKQVRCEDLSVLSAWSEHPLGDDWREFALRGLQQWFDSRCGYVYLVKVGVHEATLKVGQTRQNPWTRLKQLNHEALTSAPALYNAAYTHDRWWLEQQAHHILAAQGHHVAKEHFKVAPDKAWALLEALNAKDAARFQQLGIQSLTTPLWL